MHSFLLRKIVLQKHITIWYCGSWFEAQGLQHDRRKRPFLSCWHSHVLYKYVLLTLHILNFITSFSSSFPFQSLTQTLLGHTPLHKILNSLVGVW